MVLASDLLEQAYHLARREPKRPRQASLRRAVSTSYYALFHLLISEAALNWRQSNQRATLGRYFQHAPARGLDTIYSSFPEIPGEGNGLVGALALDVARHATDVPVAHPAYRTLAAGRARIVATGGWSGTGQRCERAVP